MFRSAVALLLVLSSFFLALSGCENAGSELTPETRLPELDIVQGSEEVVPELVLLPDAGFETTPGTTDAGFDSRFSETSTDGLEVSPGALGYPCVEGDDCDSSFCIHTPDGKQCTIPCLEDCPLGWECVQHQPSLPDEVYICAPTSMNLCKPCEKNSDCMTNGVDLGDKCVPYGGNGSFCGEACMGSGDCPSGYDCKNVLDVWGAESNQCVLVEGECQCRPWFMDEQAFTSCENTNEYGVCAGQRICVPAGLTDCDAPEPSKELCNGTDDDCDEEIDEEAGGGPCYVENEWGACLATYVCDGGNLVCDAPAAQPETCDGTDNNCDGETDEGFPDSDKDGVADCLENDKDGDGVLDIDDNCPNTKNPGQEDFDLDMAGDACDPDDDNDMSADELDCSPLDPDVNPKAEEVCNGKDDDCDALIDEGFADSDADALADCIDDDDDNDGFPDVGDCAPQDAAIYPGVIEICDGKDNDCDFDTDESFPDTDNDSLADCVDPDLDGDDIDNGADNCPKVVNPEQEDQDGDGAGDVCDPDVDGDGIPDGMDNCQVVFNPAQKDLDQDGSGDKCDDDVDGDDIIEEDNCPLVFNPGQEDQDEDGVGDACDNDADGDGDPDDSDCAPENPYVSNLAEETCDGLDNNCNGLPDEGFPDTDADGIKDCVDPDDDGDGDSDVTDCGPLDPAVHAGAVELCNGKDDNCDEKIDEELGKIACGKGLCFHSTHACIDGVVQECDPMEGASSEVCDGFDNDCDGLTDEDQGTTICGVGACYHTAPLCVDGKLGQCDPLEGAGEEVCDGVDNDCNGKIDEELGTITCGLGICMHTIAVCLGGAAQKCDPMDGAIVELCDGMDNNCDGETDEGYPDTDQDLTPDCIDLDDDGDGDPDVTDCAPADSAIHHLAEEACDGVDNNCGGGVDEEGSAGCQPYFLDGDGDGHGQQESKCLCGPAGLYKALVDDDCEDLNPWVFPGATELCDGVDNNCDAEVDEDGATGCSWFFSDADGDGYGSGAPSCVCSAPGAGWSVLTGDCDEEDSEVHPGSLELCDGEDNDCDGEVDETYDLDTDSKNCGVCGFLCQPNNALGECLGGECFIDFCVAGYDDCNEIAADGCESNTNQDASNCGGCAQVCALAHATEICLLGNCEVGACDAHYMDDDDIPENGCEETSYGKIEVDPGLTCYDILQFEPTLTDGVYWIDPHENGAAFQVYCEMDYDGGGWTLIESQGSTTPLDATYWSDAPRNVVALLSFASTPNTAARLSGADINAIFKHSQGHVQHRYNNNVAGFMLTDVFGTSDPGIVSGGTVDIAKALRGVSGHVGGFCDFYGGTGFKCCNNQGAGMNWRRYNSFQSDNLWCSGIHTYSNNGCSSNSIHGPLGDSYACNKVGQRNVEGHMWWYYGQGGVPCSNYAGYGCYGSRWIR